MPSVKQQMMVVVCPFDELTVAIQQVTRNHTFGVAHIHTPVLYYLKRWQNLNLKKHNAILVIRWSSAMYLERHGSENHVYYHCNILQLPLTTTLRSVRFRYDQLYADWCTDCSPEEARRNSEVLQESYDTIVGYLQDKHAFRPPQVVGKDPLVTRHG